MTRELAVYFVAAALYMWHKTYTPEEAVEQALDLWQMVAAKSSGGFIVDGGRGR